MGKYVITVDMETCKAPEKCDAVCLRVCPTKVLAHRPLNPAQAATNIIIQATHSLLCDGCGKCAESCIYGAITIKTKESTA